MEQLYNNVQEVAMLGVAIAAIASALRIYHKWNRGEPVIPLLITWVGGMVFAVILVEMIYGIVLMGGFESYNVIGQARAFTKDTHSAAILVGVIIAIVGVIHIYHKYTSGDDVTELVYRWVASLFFLFSFGLIIEALLV